MFCPRCGAPINDGLKYCRNCGLPISQVSTYVATGGTANLANQAADPYSSEYMTPLQRLILTIVLLALSPAIVAVTAEWLGLDGDIAGIPAVLMPVGIIWAVIHYKAIVRRRARQLSQVGNAPAVYPAHSVLPVDATYQPQLPPQRTNPLADVSQGSVVEDETRKLPEERQRNMRK